MHTQLDLQDFKTSHPVTTLFRRTLITGASVSADFCAPSPGKRLGWKYGGKDSVVTLARGGTPGRETIRRLTHDDIADRTIVIAIDFFFWDSTSHLLDASLTALQDLIELCRKPGVPLILGDIPHLLPGMQPGRAKLNAAIHAAAKASSHCSVMELDELHRQVLCEGIEFGGRRYRLTDLAPDGLHLAEVAGNYVAERLLATVTRDFTKLAQLG
ncbi:MAG: hypothetical protein ACJ763_20195 [Bdellovibrionia bacterium]